MAYYILKSYKLKFDPFQVFEILQRERNCFFLDSGLNSDRRLGRYSFLGIDPFFILKTKGIDPFGKIRKMLKGCEIYIPKTDIPFLGGAVGYFSYDLGLILEKKVKIRNKADLGMPDCFFGFYNTIIIIDHLKQLFYICAVGYPEQNVRLAKLLSEANFKKMHSLISKITSQKGNLGAGYRESSLAARGFRCRDNLHVFRRSQQESVLKNKQLKSSFTKEDYLLAVKRAKGYIRKGDIYQVNLAQGFQAESLLSGFEIYRRLRSLSPSYFSAYLDGGDFQILSSSPERFLRLDNGVVSTRPMKGTRPRSQDKLEDVRLKKELLGSAKDKAELIMIVDLERNDLGRVCSYDSVRVNVLRKLEEYSTVFQTTATVLGRLHKDKDRIDLMRACFPGGSITGCPKIRAMEIIEELEPIRRSVYTGSLGYFSFSRSMDFNILIRTILKKGDSLYFGAGGGIVADSNPEAEYRESLIKARAMIEAIK